jgi:hypothetical protein
VICASTTKIKVVAQGEGNGTPFSGTLLTAESQTLIRIADGLILLAPGQSLRGKSKLSNVAKNSLKETQRQSRIIRIDRHRYVHDSTFIQGDFYV